MAYTLPTYQTILSNIISSFQAETGQTLVQSSVLYILAESIAKQIYYMYGYAEYIAEQGVPFTATDLTLEAWGTLKNITRKSASAATGTVTFTGTNTSIIIPAGTILSVGGVQYTTDTATNINEAVGITAVVAGSAANTAAGTVLTLNSAYSGVNGTVTLAQAITSGTDMETDDELRVRVLDAFQEEPTGGSVSDHERWALAVSGVTQAWTNPTPIAGNEVVTYVMMDRTNSYGGFPQGTDGCYSGEIRYQVATGDQLTVANGMEADRPVGEILIIASPINQPVDITISGLSNLTSAQQSAVQTQLNDLFISDGTPLGTTIYLTAIIQAIQAASGSSSFTLVSPTSNVTSTLGYLSTLGTITYQS